MSNLLSLSLPTNPEDEEKNRRMHGAVFVPPPGIFEGITQALITAPLSGLEKLYRAVTDPRGKQGDPLKYQLDPELTGSVGYFLHGIAEDMTIYGTGSLIGGVFGGAIAKMATGLLAVASAQGHQRTEELRRQGVTEDTAQLSGAISGVMHAAGFTLPRPIRGAKLYQNVLAGAGQQVAFSALERKSISSILRSNGFEDQAKQFEEWDGYMLATDAVLGSIFGGIGHYTHGGVAKPSSKSSPRPGEPSPQNFPPTQEEFDTASLMKQQDHITRDMSPGIPTTPESSQMYRQVLDREYKRFENGEKVDIAPYEADTILKGMVADDARIDPALQGKQEYTVPERLGDVGETTPIFHDIDVARTALSDFVPEGDVALARFEKTHPEAGKVLREEIMQEVNDISEWKKLLQTAVDCHLE